VKGTLTVPVEDAVTEKVKGRAKGKRLLTRGKLVVQVDRKAVRSKQKKQ